MAQMGEQVVSSRGWFRRWWWALVLGVLGALLVCAVVAERAGWPWLAAPLSTFASTQLQRPVVLGLDPRVPQAHIHFWGGLSFETAKLQVGPRKEGDSDLVAAQGLNLRLRWSDLWNAWRGAPIRVDHLEASTFAANLSRDAQGRGNWLTPGSQSSSSESKWPGLQLGLLKVGHLDVRYDDALLGLSTHTLGQIDLTGATANATSIGAFASGLIQTDTTGKYRQFPLDAKLRSTAVADWMVGGKGGAWPFSFKVKVGRAKVNFEGQVDGFSPSATVSGRFDVSGPSLAAVGEPFGLVLPTTAAFAMSGSLEQQGLMSRVNVSKLNVGQSRLNGAFAFDRSAQPPRLHGRLAGSRLDLADLGPAIGAPAKTTTTAGGDSIVAAPAAPKSDRVIPQKSFNLPSLSMMDADVVVALDHFELRDGHIEALAPLRTHLTLQAGVLTLDDIMASTARGTLMGRVSLDGHDADKALWQADLRWRDVVLQKWIPALAPEGRAPYLAGRLNGQLDVKGQGKSTADMLGSLNGEIRMTLMDGQISHLAVEAAGLDVAQGLGVFISGDKDLPLSCARMDIDARQGVLRARRVVFDTGDSLMRVMGDVSLRDEHLALEAKVSPKDVSPLALRTPIQVTGTLGAPKVSIQATKLLPRVAGAVALGLINPLAAIVPFIDLGDSKAKAEAMQGCADAVRASR